jgi:hypothetical protein
MARTADPAGPRPAAPQRLGALLYRLRAVGIALLVAYLDRHDGDATELLAVVAVGAGVLRPSNLPRR